MKQIIVILLFITQPLSAQQIIEVVPGSVLNKTKTNNGYDQYTEQTDLKNNNGGIQAIVSVTQIAQLTGQPSMNNTGQVNVYGTDLGSMFLYSDGKIYFLFGDTFGSPGTPGSSGDWRSNTMAYTTDFVADDGIVFDGWITDASGFAKTLMEGNHDPNDGSGEVTRIPTAGWSFGNLQFMWYMSVKQWGTPGGWEVNHSEIAYSENNGNTWFRSGVQQPGNSNFIQVAVVEQSDSLLFFGIPAGRFGGVKLAKVLPSDVLTKNAYLYYTGTGWSSNEADGILIVDPPVGELSVLWNPYLMRWIMMYLNESTARIEVREAVVPTGPWSEPWEVVSANNYPALYGAFMHNKYMKNNGETVYFLMSQFGSYNVFLMKVVFQRIETEVDNDPLSAEIPQSYTLHQNYPNPFNPDTVIEYHLPNSSFVEIAIFNLSGQRIVTLLKKYQNAGTFELKWDGTNEKGESVVSGVYIYQLKAGEFVAVKKMMLLR